MSYDSYKITPVQELPDDFPLTQAFIALNDAAEGEDSIENTLSALGFPGQIEDILSFIEARSKSDIASAALPPFITALLKPSELNSIIENSKSWKLLRPYMSATYLEGLAVGWIAHQQAEASQTTYTNAAYPADQDDELLRAAEELGINLGGFFGTATDEDRRTPPEVLQDNILDALDTLLEGDAAITTHSGVKAINEAKKVVKNYLQPLVETGSSL